MQQREEQADLRRFQLDISHFVNEQWIVGEIPSQHLGIQSDPQGSETTR